MKKNRILSSLTSMAIAVCSTVPMMTRAEDTIEVKEYGNYLEEVIAEIGEEKITFDAYGNEHDYVAIMMPDELKLLFETKTGLEIKVKSGSTLPFEEFEKATEGNYTLIHNRDQDDNYLDSYYFARINTNLVFTEEELLDILFNIDTENVITNITREHFVLENTGYWGIAGIAMTSDLSAEELINRYSELALVESENNSENENIYSIRSGKEYTYEFDFNDYIIQDYNYACENNEITSNNFDFYETIKNLSQDPDISNWEFKACWEGAELMSSSQTLVSKKDYLYVMEMQGDSNADGIISIADVISVSAFVSNSEKNSLSEQSVKNADVYNTGDGLNASDALMIQQYATGKIDSLS